MITEIKGVRNRRGARGGLGANAIDSRGLSVPTLRRSPASGAFVRGIRTFSQGDFQ
jgi:hypothetical protein